MKLTLFQFIIIFLTNCISYSASSKQMESSISSFSESIGENVCVNSVIGRYLERENKEKIYFIYVDASELKRAVQESIIKTKIFKNNGNCNWKIDIVLQLLERKGEFIVSDPEVEAKIQYNFLFNEQSKTIFHINSTGKVKFFEARFGTERAGKAMELSIKNNIQEFLTRISKFRFNPDGTITQIEKNKIIE